MRCHHCKRTLRPAYAALFRWLKQPPRCFDCYERVQDALWRQNELGGHSCER